MKEGTGMNPKIKERIEQIRQGIVPEGYKKTRIGIIPEEWEVKALSDVCHVTMGQSPKSEFYNDEKEGLPLIQGNADIKNGKTFPKIYTTDITKRCFPNDIILSVRAPVGEVSWSVHEACIGRGVCSISTREGYDNKFLFYYLLDNEVKWEKYSQGSTFKAVNSRDIRAFPVLNIPLLEQQQIAEILSTWDRAIELKEALIKEKEEQKKGFMQLLLKKDNQYEVVKLEEISKTSSGGTPKRTVSEYYNGDIPWVVISDITSSGKYLYDTATKITKKGLENSSAKLYPKDVILYAMYASIGECTIAKEKVSSNQAILCIDLNKEKADLEYVYYYLNSIKDRIKLKGQQGTQSNLNAGMVRNFNIPLPPLSKQKQISRTLATADLEIQLLNQKLEFLKEQKKGLMQLLLTGIVRVGEVEELE